MTTTTFSMVAAIALIATASAMQIDFFSCSSTVDGKTIHETCQNCSKTHIDNQKRCLTFGDDVYQSPWSEQFGATSVSVECTAPTGAGDADDPRCVSITSFQDCLWGFNPEQQVVMCDTCHPVYEKGIAVKYTSTKCSRSGNVLITMTCKDQDCHQCDSDTMQTFLAGQCSTDHKIISQAYPCLMATVTLYNQTHYGDNHCDANNAVTHRKAPSDHCMYGDFYAVCKPPAGWVPPHQGTQDEPLYDAETHLDTYHCTAKTCLSQDTGDSTCHKQRRFPTDACVSAITGELWRPELVGYQQNSPVPLSYITCPPADDLKYKKDCMEVAFWLKGADVKKDPQFASYTFVCGTTNTILDPRSKEPRHTLQVVCPDDKSKLQLTRCDAEGKNCDPTDDILMGSPTEINKRLYIDGLSPNTQDAIFPTYQAVLVQNDHTCRVYTNVTYRDTNTCTGGGGTNFVDPEKIVFSGELAQARCAAGGLFTCVYPDEEDNFLPSWFKMAVKHNYGTSADSKYEVWSQQCELEDRYVLGYYMDTKLINPQTRQVFTEDVCQAPNTLSPYFAKANCKGWQSEPDKPCASLIYAPKCSLASNLSSADQQALVCGKCFTHPVKGRYTLECVDMYVLNFKTNCTKDCEECSRTFTIDNRKDECQSHNFFDDFYVSRWVLEKCTSIAISEWEGEVGCQGTPDGYKEIAHGQCNSDRIAYYCSMKDEEASAPASTSYYQRYKTYLAFFVITFLILIGLCLMYGRLHHRMSTQQDQYLKMNDDGSDNVMPSRGGGSAGSYAHQQQHRQSNDVQMGRVHAPARQEPVSIVEQETAELDTSTDGHNV